MKYLYVIAGVVTGLIVLCSATACGKVPTQTDEIPDQCADYIKPYGIYEGHLLATENGEVFWDDVGSAAVFQSGGRGTSWSGLTGTANDTQVTVRYPPQQWFQYTVTTEGYATLTEATFDIIYESDDETIALHYEFTDLVRVSNALQSGTVIGGLLGLSIPADAELYMEGHLRGE